MDRVLVTGGAGFIGSSIVDELYREQKYEVIVLDNFSEQIHGVDYRKSYLYQSIKDKCKIVRGDIRKTTDVEKALKDVDYIIHLAAETGTGQSMYEIHKYTDVNIMGTANLFDVLLNKKLNIKKIILASSRSVYGEGMYFCREHGIIVPKLREVEDMRAGKFSLKCPFCLKEMEPSKTTEKCPLSPVSYYAYTKLAQEKLLETMCPNFNIPYTIFRYQNVYGAGQSLNNPYTGILSIFSKLLLQNKPINIFEDGKESRDFIHVQDVAAVTCNAIENPITDYKHINVGYGKSVSVLKVAILLKKLYASSSKIIVSGDFRRGDIRHNVADIQKAKDLCAFHPKYNFEEGVKQFAMWVVSQGQKEQDLVLKDRYEQSMHELQAMGMLIGR